MRRDGFSFIEVMIACVVIGLATVPLLGLLSSSNRTSKASVFEIMAVQYAEELSEQILRLGPRLKTIRDATGNDLKALLESPLVAEGLRQPVPSLIPLPGTQITLSCGPLDRNFTARTIRVEPLDRSGKQVLKTGAYWRVSIGLEWQISSGDGPVHGTTFAFLVREVP